MTSIALNTTSSMPAASGALTLVARILLAAMFFMSGISKLTGLEGTAGYIASVGLPMPQVLAIGAAVLEVAAGAMLIVGWQARWAALALALFTLVATFFFHNFWAMPADKQMLQQIIFMKNLAVIGGLLFVFAFGPGALSIDARRPRR